MNELEVTTIQRFKSDCGVSYNVAINDAWMIQLDCEGTFSIPGSNEATWRDAGPQDRASEFYSASEVAEHLQLRELIDDPSTVFDDY